MIRDTAVHEQIGNSLQHALGVQPLRHVDRWGSTVRRSPSGSLPACPVAELEALAIKSKVGGGRRAGTGRVERPAKCGALAAAHQARRDMLLCRRPAVVAGAP